MRLPSLPIFRITSRWIFLALLAVLIGLGYFLWKAPFFRVEAAQLEGLNQVNSSNVHAVLDVIDKPIFLLKSTDLEQELQNAFPEFSAVSVDLKLPNSVLVNVKERTPVLTWRQNDHIQLVDQEGYAFPLRLEATMVITPVVEAAGSPPAIELSPEMIAALAENDLQAAAENNGATTAAEKQSELVKNAPLQPFLTSEMVTAILAISQVVPANQPLLYSSEHGLGWQDERGWQVYLGNAEDMEMKLKVYDAIVLRLIDEEVQPVLISVEHVHNPYFRLDQ